MIQHAMILHTRKNEEGGTQTRLWTQKTLYIMLLVGDLRGIGCEYLWQIDHVIPRLHCSLIFTGSGNGLLPVRQQATTWTNDDLLLCFASEEFRAWIWLTFSGTTKHQLCQSSPAKLCIGYQLLWFLASDVTSQESPGVLEQEQGFSLYLVMLNLFF